VVINAIGTIIEIIIINIYKKLQLRLNKKIVFNFKIELENKLFENKIFPVLY